MKCKYANFFDYIKNNNLGITIKDADLKKYCTLKIGGKCYCLYKPNSAKSLTTAYKYILSKKLDYFIIGNGSNLLISDDYHFKIFICLKGLNTISLNENLLTVDAGVMGNVLAKKISEQGLSGLEFLAGIPGTIGGMIYMNAGAHGKSMKDILESIIYIDEFGKICTMTDIESKGFGYRLSPFMKRKVIILSCVIKLEKDISSIKKYHNYLDKKITTQPLKECSAGCVFKNPKNKKAWELIIDSTTIKSIENAYISDIHSNFFINKKNATYIDMLTLIKQVQSDVYLKHKILLECEIKIVE